MATAFSVKKQRKKKVNAALTPKGASQQKSQRASTSTTSPRRGLWQRAKWITGSLVALFGLMGTALSVWDIWIQNNPTVEVPSVSDKFDILPFTITIPSHFFSIYSLKTKCSATSLLGLSTAHNIRAVVIFQPFDIPAQESRLITCSFPYAKNERQIYRRYDKNTASVRCPLLHFSNKTYLAF